MTIFWERYNALSTAKDGSPNKTAKILGLSSGSVTAWSRGTIPLTETVILIATYFEVTPDYMLGIEKPTAPDGGQPIPPEVAALIDEIQDLSKAEAAAVREYAQFVKQKRTGKP